MLTPQLDVRIRDASNSPQIATTGWPMRGCQSEGGRPVTSCQGNAGEQPYALGIVIRHGFQLQRPGGAIFHCTRRAQKERVGPLLIALQALPRPFAMLLNSFTLQAELFWKSTRSVTLMLSYANCMPALPTR